MTMIAHATSVLLWGSAIGCGLMAGVYFAFSTFVMRSLARIAPAAGVAAMNAINVEIVRSPFMPLFLGTTLSALALAVIALVGRAQPGAVAIVAGAALYAVGMFAVTMAFNVPLNDALASVDPATTQGVALWSRYLHDWTRWNHVRTVASAAACVCFIVGIVAR